MIKKNQKREFGETSWRAGLKITINAQGTAVIETTPDHDAACERFERVRSFVADLSVKETAHPGGLLILQHVTYNLILDEGALWLSTGHSARVYKHEGDHYLEWQDENGWRDRRLIAPCSARSIQAAGGPVITLKERRWVTRQLRELVPEAKGVQVWCALMADAQAWWYQHVSGPLRDHAMALLPLQALPRSAMARGLSGLPQAHSQDTASESPPDFEHFPPSGLREGGLATIHEVQALVASIATQKQSKHAGREAIIERIDQLLPRAAQESLACLYSLGALRHALLAGGASGRLWAPVTVLGYLREGVEPIAAALTDIDPDSLDGAGWHALYTQVMEPILGSQKAKYHAFIQVFHRFMVIAGAEPLPFPLAAGEQLMPPVAAAVHPHEVELALQYIDARAPSEQVRLQARIIVQLGFEVPMRTYEFWCLRVGDVQGGLSLSVVIYPRLVDGICKSPALRRVEDVQGIEVRRDLLALQRLRRVTASESDVLFGSAGRMHARHQEKLTNALVNAALRWATGDPRASIYDLRHACISRIAAQTL